MKFLTIAVLVALASEALTLTVSHNQLNHQKNYNEHNQSWPPSSSATQVNGSTAGKTAP